MRHFIWVFTVCKSSRLGVSRILRGNDNNCRKCFPTELQISFWVNWVFRQPDYSQLRTCKINCVFLFFTPRFLWLQIMSAMFFLLNVAIGNLPAYIYSLTPFALLEHQISGFYHTSVANLVFLLIFIARIHITSFTSMFFPLNTWLVINILFIKLEFYCVHACKKINTRLHYVLLKWKRNGPNGTRYHRM